MARSAIDTVCVAHDLSARSDRALTRAVTLAREHGGALRVIHVSDAATPERVRPSVQSAVTADLRDAIERIPASHGVTVSVDSVFANRAKGVLNASAEAEADLIVMGPRGPSAFDLFGSTSERILRHARAPVLVVKNHGDTPYRRVMVAVDFSVCSRVAMRAARTIAPEAAIVCVHAYQIPFAGLLDADGARESMHASHEREMRALIREELDAWGDDGDGPTERMLVEGPPHAALAQAAADIAPDLMVLGAHGRVGAVGAAMGGVAMAFLTEPPCDVMAVKAW